MTLDRLIKSLVETRRVGKRIDVRTEARRLRMSPKELWLTVTKDSRFAASLAPIPWLMLPEDGESNWLRQYLLSNAKQLQRDSGYVADVALLKNAIYATPDLQSQATQDLAEQAVAIFYPTKQSLEFRLRLAANAKQRMPDAKEKIRYFMENAPTLVGDAKQIIDLLVTKYERAHVLQKLSTYGLINYRISPRTVHGTTKVWDIVYWILDRNQLRAIKPAEQHVEDNPYADMPDNVWERSEKVAHST